jgi:hypothetical protein
MANDHSRRAATIIAPATGQTGAEKIAAEPGFPKPVYYLTLDTFDLYKFVPGDTSTADDYNVIDPQGGGTSGRYIRIVPGGDPLGDDLTDADATLTVAQGRAHVLPTSTLTDNRTATLSTTGAQVGDRKIISRQDQEAYTYTVNNGLDDSAIAMLNASTKQWVEFLYKSAAAGWIQLAAGPLL